MTFSFILTVELERETGKFESKESLAESLREAIAGADPGSIEGSENGGTYNVTSFEVEIQ